MCPIALLHANSTLAVSCTTLREVYICVHVCVFLLYLAYVRTTYIAHSCQENVADIKCECVSHKYVHCVDSTYREQSSCVVFHSSVVCGGGQELLNA